MDGYEQFRQSWNNRGNIHWNKIQNILVMSYAFVASHGKRTKKITGLKKKTNTFM